MPLRVLHLSDIHFSTKFDEEKILHTDVRDQLLNDLRDVIVPRLGNMDMVLIAGDIAFSGKRAEYEEATEWLEQIALICGCKRTDVLTVPGNHDVDRHRILPATRVTTNTYGRVLSLKPNSNLWNLLPRMTDC